MNERLVTIETPDGAAQAHLYHGTDPKPGVLFITDIFGIRDANLGMAQRLAEDGHTVLVPNVFYRIGPPPFIDVDAAAEVIRARFGELVEPLTPEAVEHDMRAYVDYLVGCPESAGKSIGATGYCFGGPLVMRAAAARPENVAAVATFHGGGLCTDQPDSPHLLLPKIKANFYFGHAYNDRGMPAEAIERLEAALDEWGGSYKSHVHGQAGHGWTVPDRPVYDEVEAEKAYAELVSLLKTSL